LAEGFPRTLVELPPWFEERAAEELAQRLPEKKKAEEEGATTSQLMKVGQDDDAKVIKRDPQRPADREREALSGWRCSVQRSAPGSLICCA
jgi:hypothetical protein